MYRWFLMQILEMQLTFFMQEVEGDLGGPWETYNFCGLKSKKYVCLKE